MSPNESKKKLFHLVASSAESVEKFSKIIMKWLEEDFIRTWEDSRFSRFPSETSYITRSSQAINNLESLLLKAKVTKLTLKKK